MLPPLIPIFPLPNVVLFPSVFLPLHIFEPRYRQMLADALRGDRIIGMVLLKGGRDDIEEPPPVYTIGCAGLVSHAETLQDGRSNIILRGIQRFRVVREEADRVYRQAQIEPLREAASDTIRGDVPGRRVPSSRHCWPVGSRPPAERRWCRGTWRTRISSTPWRSISTSTRWRSRRCSNATTPPADPGP